jgi:hypothetical protein
MKRIFMVIGICFVLNNLSYASSVPGADEVNLTTNAPLVFEDKTIVAMLAAMPDYSAENKGNYKQIIGQINELITNFIHIKSFWIDEVSKLMDLGVKLDPRADIGFIFTERMKPDDDLNYEALQDLESIYSLRKSDAPSKGHTFICRGNNLVAALSQLYEEQEISNLFLVKLRDRLFLNNTILLTVMKIYCTMSHNKSTDKKIYDLNETKPHYFNCYTSFEKCYGLLVGNCLIRHKKVHMLHRLETAPLPNDCINIVFQNFDWPKSLEEHNRQNAAYLYFLSSMMFTATSRSTPAYFDPIRELRRIFFEPQREMDAATLSVRVLSELKIEAVAKEAARVQELTAAGQDLMSKLNGSRELNTRLSAQVIELRQNLKDSEIVLQNFTTQFFDLEGVCKSAKAADGVQKKYYEQKIRDLKSGHKANLEGLQLESVRLKAEVVTKDRQLAQQVEELAGHRERVEKLERNHQEQIEAVELEIAALKQEHETKIQKSSETIRVLRGKLKAAEAESQFIQQGLKQKVQELQEELQVNIDSAGQVQQERTDLIKRMAVLQTKCESERKQIVHLKAELKKVKGSLLASHLLVQEERDQALASYQQVSEAYALLLQQTQQLSFAHQALQAAHMAGVSGELLERNAQLEEENAQLRAMLEALKETPQDQAEK